jgi:hypothetical protein
MKCSVAVYHFRDPDDHYAPGQYAVRSVLLDLVSTVDVEGAWLSPAGVAARAWIAAVGRKRQAFLIGLEAPAMIVKSECDQQTVAAGMREAPAGFSGLHGFIFDNQVESWFIKLDDEWEPDRHAADLHPQPSRRFDIAKPEAVTEVAVLRSLWEPRLN